MTLKPWRQIITPHEDILLDKNVPHYLIRSNPWESHRQAGCLPLDYQRLLWRERRDSKLVLPLFEVSVYLAGHPGSVQACFKAPIAGNTRGFL